MRIGIPKEVKSNEFRVSVTPSGVAELVHRGHDAVSYTHLTLPTIYSV